MQVKIRFCDIIPALSLGHYNFFLWWERTPKKALVAPTLLFRNILGISPNKNVELWIFNLALLHHIFQYTSLNTSLNTHEITGKRNSCSIKYLVRLQHPLLIGHAYIYFKIWQSSVFSCQTRQHFFYYFKVILSWFGFYYSRLDTLVNPRFAETNRFVCCDPNMMIKASWLTFINFNELTCHI